MSITDLVVLALAVVSVIHSFCIMALQRRCESLPAQAARKARKDGPFR
jgi:hypothetical protein